jgi:molecular chaperone HscA
MMGRSLADIQTRYPHLPYQLQASENGLPMIQTAGGLLNPIRVSADILKALAARATEALSGELDGVVITVRPILTMLSVRAPKTPRVWLCTYCAC